MTGKVRSTLVALFLTCALAACAPAQLRTPRAGGDTVAAALNARFDDTRMSCAGGTPAYDCTGVFIRATGASPSYHAWNPNPDAGISGISFSYLRRDVGSRVLYGDQVRPQGLIFGPGDTFGSGGVLPLTVLCAFPYDAVTGPNRAPDGCQAFRPDFPPENGPCLAQGIVTVDAWLAHFHSVTSFQGRYRHQCAFGGDQFSFELALRSRVNWEDEFEVMQHMELMLSSWPQDVPDQLPLEAIFYTAGGPDALANARFIQADLARASGRFVPVVRFTTDVSQEPFSFHPEDQGVAAVAAPRR